MPLPSARMQVHGLGGHAVRAGARARFAARRAGAYSLTAAKVILWLTVVVASMAAIAVLAVRGSPYRQHGVDPMQASAHAR